MSYSTTNIHRVTSITAATQSVMNLANENERLRRTVAALEGIIDGLKRQAESNRVMASVGRHALRVERDSAEFGCDDQ